MNTTLDNTLAQPSIAARLATVSKGYTSVPTENMIAAESKQQQFECFVGKYIPNPLDHDRDTHDECQESDVMYDNYVNIDGVTDESEEHVMEINVETTSLHSMLTSTTCSDEESISNFTSSTDEDSNESIMSGSTRSILKTSNSCRKRRKLRTSFSTLEIREYDITLGDNPGGSQGPPISLDWDYNKRRTEVITLEDYEEKRRPRRCRSGMHIPDSMRMWILVREKRFTLRQLQRATRDAKLIRMQRRKSARYYNLQQRFSNAIFGHSQRRQTVDTNTKANANNFITI